MNLVLEKFVIILLFIFTPHIEAFVVLTATARCSNLDSNRVTSEEVNFSSTTGPKPSVGFTTDGWNVGMRKYKDFLAVHKMVSRVQKQDVQCIEVIE